jgi:hypothetical protein
MNDSQENKHEGQVDDKDITIIVNGREKVVTKKELSFEEIVALAFDNSDPNTIYTITYSKGMDNKPQGELAAGQTVKIKKGMIFNVSPTGKS